MDSDVDNKRQEEFDQKVEELIKKYMVKPADTEEYTKTAVNF